MPDTTNQDIDHIRTMRTVEMFANQEDFIRRNITELSNAIEQATNELVQIIQGTHPRHRRLIQDLRERAASTREASGRWTDQRILNVLDAINSIADEIETKAGERLIRSSSAIASDVYENYPEIFSLDGAIPVRFDTLSTAQIRAFVEDTVIGSARLDYFVRRIFRTPTMRADLRNEIFVGALQGESIPKLSRRLREQFNWLDSKQMRDLRRQTVNKGYNPGTKAFSDEMARKVKKRINHNVTTIARSTMQAAANDSMQIIYDGNQDIIQGYEWNSTMEPGYMKTGRGTCIRCASLDGMMYDKNETRPPIPLHPNCRCIYTPITKSWQDLGLSDDDVEGIMARNRPYLTRESDAEVAVGEGRAIGKGGRKILGRRGEQVSDAQLRREQKLYSTTTNTPFGTRRYREWYDDRSNLFKVNIVGPSRAAWLEQVNRRNLNDLVHKDTGELKLLSELTGNPEVITRRDFVNEYGTQEEIQRFNENN